MGCFPPEAEVRLREGTRPIPNLSPTDQLLTLRFDKKGRQVCVKEDHFYTYLHFDREFTDQFIVLRCEKGLELIISEEHLIFKGTGEGTISKAVMANTIVVGDYLVYLHESQTYSTVRVEGIGRKEVTGVFAPMTKSGTMIVNGFLVSCYASYPSHAKAHASLAPLRLWYRTKTRIGGRDSTDDQPGELGVGMSTKETPDGIHSYAKALMTIFRVEDQ
jgi:hypothetical protein